MGASIRYGEKLVTQTQIYAKAYVGNGLNCTSCHLDGGRTPYASPWVGVWGVYPEYRSRNARVDTLEDRINDCFRRSMNGKALPIDSDRMRAIASYMWWLSKDVPTGVDVEGRGFAQIKLPPEAQIDAARGKQLYAEKCSACHGANGDGQTGANGAYLFPALWGPKSFNVGAGMARLGNAAAFIRKNMPSAPAILCPSATRSISPLISRGSRGRISRPRTRTTRAATSLRMRGTTRRDAIMFIPLAVAFAARRAALGPTRPHPGTP